MQGVANRDIKLENTLLDSTTKPLIKICDFGYSKVTAPVCACLTRLCASQRTGSGTACVTAPDV